ALLPLGLAADFYDRKNVHFSCTNAWDQSFTGYDLKNKKKLFFRVLFDLSRGELFDRRGINPRPGHQFLVPHGALYKSLPGVIPDDKGCISCLAADCPAERSAESDEKSVQTRQPGRIVSSRSASGTERWESSCFKISSLPFTSSFF